MANEHKNRILRQHSLNCEATPLQQRRKTFKKQFSQDTPSDTDQILSPISISFSAKTRSSKNIKDQVPPVKIAWAEEIPLLEQSYKPGELLVATKCKEAKRPLSKQCSFEKETIAYPRTYYTDRLRQAWKERENTKQNLDIFLNHVTNGRNVEEEETISNKCLEAKRTPKINTPLTPSDVCGEQDNLKHIFQKYNKKPSIRPHTAIHCPVASPKTNEQRPNTLVVVPIIVPNEEKNENAEKDHSSSKRSSRASSPKPIDVIIRPSTAAAKRQNFQKRTNSAFNGSSSSNFRPPLTRASSLPVKPSDKARPKFTATKRHLKSAKRKENKKVDDNNGGEHENKPQNKAGAEIVTMVSLVSPSGSDTEESREKDERKIEKSPKKANVVKKDELINGGVSLRKTIKSVSFQQSTIHAVRSFSASFPARRGSVATGMMLRNSAKGQKIHEKRGTTDDVPDSGEMVVKRRLVRILSVETSNRFKTPHEATSAANGKGTDATENSEQLLDISFPEKRKNNTTGNCDEKCESRGVSTQNEEKAKSNDEFESQNAKQCWELYRKMSEKGVTVSFDTILRGMLTPTEYRLHRSRLQASEDNNC